MIIFATIMKKTGEISASGIYMWAVRHHADLAYSLVRL